jgi:HD-GYP domain-containing protein (c-di-GMP phosphodiesterase class II)
MIARDKSRVFRCRMLLIPVKALKGGMQIAQPVFHPKREEIILLEPGYILTDPIVSRLVEFDIGNVWVDFPDLEDVDRTVNTQVSMDHMQLFQELRGAIGRFKRRVALDMNFNDYRRVIEKILLDIVDDPNHQVLTNNLADCGQEMAGHMANCCYMSLLLGAHMSGYLRLQRKALPPNIAEDTHRLGLGAMLHDVGKAGLPVALRDKTILDPESSLPEYRYHTIVGYEQVKGRLPATVTHIVLHHHQRFDGQGFPDRVDPRTGDRKPPPCGSGIHIFCRVVGLLDTFDRLLWAGSNNGKARPTVYALADLLSPRFEGWFDPVVMSFLLRLVPPFMVGSVVRLNSGEYAVVVDNHAEASCRPTVRILTDSIFKRGARVKRKAVDLRLRDDLHVAEVDGQSVAAQAKIVEKAASAVWALV